MKVTISVGGKFNAFYLARHLEEKGYLDRIFTSSPWFAVKDFRLPRNKVDCLVMKEILERLMHRIPYLSKKIDICRYIFNFFDNLVAARVKPCDIFIGSSGYSLFTLRKIRKTSPAKLILQRISSHIETYRDILIEEQERLGIGLDLPSPGVVNKELEEYTEADYILVPSTLVRRTFLDKNFLESKIIPIPWGVDIGIFKPIPKRDNVFRIICVGMRIIKGVHYLLQAIDELRIKNLQVWLIGGRVDNALIPFLKKYSKNFQYLGAIPQRELYKYYSQGSLLVLFSLEDGLGLASLEAMACGLPVIYSDMAGAKDVIRNNIDGLMVPARDVEALKEKILYLYENQNICQEMGRHAYENVTKNFTWDNYGQRVVNTLLNLLK